MKNELQEKVDIILGRDSIINNNNHLCNYNVEKLKFVSKEMESILVSLIERGLSDTFEHVLNESHKRNNYSIIKPELIKDFLLLVKDDGEINRNLTFHAMKRELIWEMVKREVNDICKFHETIVLDKSYFLKQLYRNEDILKFIDLSYACMNYVVNFDNNTSRFSKVSINDVLQSKGKKMKRLLSSYLNSQYIMYELYTHGQPSIKKTNLVEKVKSYLSF